jgi:mono/diheme cytochrome c family protein
MRNLLKALLLPSVAIIAIVSGVGMYAVKSGLRARDTPNSLESQIALRLRRLAVPKGAKQQKNPFSPSAELLTDARRHFADHCASCHANNGSGNTQLGHSLYPRAPDMREPRTQSLSDGELYYIVHNGIRFTGMPAWGGDHDEDSWKLVLFIRQLRQLEPSELADMERFNPKSPADSEEGKSEEDFLNSKQLKSTHQH